MIDEEEILILRKEKYPFLVKDVELTVKLCFPDETGEFTATTTGPDLKYRDKVGFRHKMFRQTIQKTKEKTEGGVGWIFSWGDQVEANVIDWIQTLMKAAAGQLPPSQQKYFNQTVRYKCEPILDLTIEFNRQVLTELCAK